MAVSFCAGRINAAKSDQHNARKAGQLRNLVTTLINHLNQLPTQRRQVAKGAKQHKKGISFAFFASLRLRVGNLVPNVNSYDI